MDLKTKSLVLSALIAVISYCLATVVGGGISRLSELQLPVLIAAGLSTGLSVGWLMFVFKKLQDERNAIVAKANSDMSQKQREHDQTRRHLVEESDTRAAESQHRLDEMALQNAEMELILNTFAATCRVSTGSSDLFAVMLRQLSEAQIQGAKSSAVFWLNESRFSLFSQTGMEKINQFSYRPEHEALLHDVLKEQNVRVLSDEDLKQYYMENSQLRFYRGGMYFPIVLDSQGLGVLCLYLHEETASEKLQQPIRVVRKLLQLSGHLFDKYRHIEQELEAARIDPLTKLPNERFLYEKLPDILDSCTSANKPLSVVMLEGDMMNEINDKYGRLVGDEMLRELVDTVCTNARLEELSSDRSEYADHFVRNGPITLTAILENTDEKAAIQVAERMRSAVTSRREWPGGVPQWSISAGVVTSPEDGKQLEELLAKANVALLYVKEKLGPNNAVAFNTVPRIFKVAKLGAQFGGSLGVFDPAVLIQSLSTSKKSGILTVSNSQDRIFWLFMQNGEPKKAYVDKLTSDDGVLEFVTTFEDGDFKFQEYNTLDTETIERIHSMDTEFDVRRSISHLLVEAGRAQDKLANAKRMIPNTRLFVRPTTDAKQLWNDLPQAKNPPSAQELKVMGYLLKQVNGKNMLSQIFERTYMYPTFMNWHAAHLLLKHQIVEVSRISGHFAF